MHADCNHFCHRLLLSFWFVCFVVVVGVVVVVVLSLWSELFITHSSVLEKNLVHEKRCGLLGFITVYF